MQWKCYGSEPIKDGVRITEYVPEGDEEALCIPSHIEGTPVVEIGEAAFSENGTFLTRIEIPPTVKRIGRDAFRMCLNLTELILHDGLERIEEEALFLTPLSEVALPDTLRSIAAPWDLASIRFVVSEASPYFFSDGFCLFQRTDAPGAPEADRNDAPATREAHGDDEPTGKLALLVALQEDPRESYDIPEGTVVIGENAFSGNDSLKRVSVPGTVHTIGEAAFEGCQNLSEVILTEGLRAIGSNAFGHCIRLASIHLPASVQTIGEFALSDTFGWSESFLGLTRITVEPGNARFAADTNALFEIADDGSRSVVKYFGEGGTYRIPDEVSRILPGAFRRAKFYRCEIPARVSSVGKDAFRECKNLSEIILGETDTVLYIPAQPLYRKDEVTALFSASRGEGEYLYDYEGYDALFDTYLNLPDRYGMACCRLRYPVLLSDETAEKYCAFLWENLSAILQNIAQRQDMESLVMLAELGFFTEDNIEESLEVMSRSGQAKLTGYLLRYKRENMAREPFDFSL